METAGQSIHLRKAEINALAEFTRKGDDVGDQAYVWFSLGRDSHVLRAFATDGHRVIEATFPLGDDCEIEGPIELGLDAGFLRDAARLVKSSEGHRVALNLPQLLRSATGQTLSRATVIDVENATQDGEAVELREVSVRGAVAAQIGLDMAMVRSLLTIPSGDADAVRSLCLNPKYLASLKKVSDGARNGSCRIFMPQDERHPTLVLFEHPSRPDVWSVVIYPMKDDRTSKDLDAGEFDSADDDDVEPASVGPAPSRAGRVPKGAGRKKPVAPGHSSEMFTGGEL